MYDYYKYYAYTIGETYLGYMYNTEDYNKNYSFVHTIMDKFLDLIKTTNTKVKEVQNYYMNIAEDMKKEYKINRAVLNPYYARADYQ